MDFSNLDPKAIFGTLLRTLGGLVAGWLIKKGVVEEAQSGMIVGVVVGFITLGWSVIQKYRARAAEKAKIEIAIQSPVTTSVEQVEILQASK